MSEEETVVSEQPLSKINLEWAQPYYDSDQNRYDKIYSNLKLDLTNPDALKTKKKREKGVTRKNQSAMKNLADMVSSKMHVDVSRNNELLNPDSAKKWIKRHGYEGFYTTKTKDLDEDGIPEQLIVDKKGNLVYVNGYTVKESDLPYRMLYYKQPKETRKELQNEYKELGKPYGYKQYIRDEYYNPIYDGDGISIVGYTGHDPKMDIFTQNLKKQHYKIIKPRSRTPYQVFSIRFVKPMYDYTIARYKLFTATGGKPNVYVSVLSAAWNHLIIFPALTAIYNDANRAQQVLDNEPETLNKIKKTSQFKLYIARVMYNFLEHSNNKNSNVMEVIHNIVVYFATNWFENHPNIQKCDNWGEVDSSVEVPDLTNVISPQNSAEGSPQKEIPNHNISNNDEE